MAGATIVGRRPEPGGFWYTRLGGYFEASEATAIALDTFLVPFDCYVKWLALSCTSLGSAWPLTITIATIDATKTLATIAAPSANVEGVVQTLHADVTTPQYLVKAGDKIQVKFTTGAGGTGNLWFTLGLEPVYK